MHWRSNTRRSCRWWEDNIWQSLLSIKCQIMYSLKKHRLIWVNSAERLLQLSLTWLNCLNQSNNFRHCFKHCQMSMLWSAMSLMLKTILMLREICRSFRRKRYSLRLMRLSLSCEQTNKKKINVQWIRTAVHWITVQWILSNNITDHLAQTVIIFLITSSSTFFTTAFTSFKTANFFLMLSETFKRRQAGWLQLSCTD